MKAANPKCVLREWSVAPAHQAAHDGNCEPPHKLQTIVRAPHAEQSAEIEEQCDSLKPKQFWGFQGFKNMRDKLSLFFCVATFALLRDGCPNCELIQTSVC